MIGLKAQALPAVLARPLAGVCDLVVLLIQKSCEAILVLFIHPEMRYNPVTQQLIDRKREIAGKLAGVSERELTRLLRDRIQENNRRRARRVRSSGFLSDRLSSELNRSGSDRNPDEPFPLGFGIVIPFYRHLTFFGDCLHSVAAAAESLRNSELSIVVVNDDPEVDDAVLQSRVPAALKPFTQILGNKANIGISRTLNRGIMASHQPWLLFLDCDDKIDPACFQVLKTAIQNRPDAVYFSSQMMLIDDRDEFLGYYLRRRTVPDQADNQVASHLKVFRRELFAEIGYHNPQFNGCQDYELALRVAIQRRIDFIPDFLYVYRWHTYNQAVSASTTQNLQRKKISQVYRLLIWALTSGAAPVCILGDGPFKDSWLQKLPRSTPSTFLTVSLPFVSSWSLSAMIYLLADALGVVYSLWLDGHKTPVTISLPENYLEPLGATCCDFLR